MNREDKKSLKGRTLWIHPMTRSGALFLAASYRSIGIDAHVLPPSDSRTLELGSMYSAGDECLPEKVTLGDYLKITEAEGFDPDRTAFLMPTACGPCRFGQYSTLLEMVLRKCGMEEVLVITPTSENGYNGFADNGLYFLRTMFISVVCSDIVRKMLLKTRPYEKVAGTTNEVYERSLSRIESIIETPGLGFRKFFSMMREEMVRTRDEFRAIDADYVKRKPLIAALGEIFCRHNKFANENMLSKLEEHGAETWIADVNEWVFFTDWTKRNNLIRLGRKFSKDMALVKLKTYIMKKDEHKLLEPFHEDFRGYEEPSDISILTDYAEPYLPSSGALGEMSLSLGRSGYCYNKGIDGIVDISPFSCMNGIVSESVYPSFSRDHNDIPSRVFYYDGINSDIDRDLGIFMELVRGYMSRKKVKRVYPHFFREE
ncbi:hypothetical protein ACFL1R_03230 [Candidatus Latescibacterota bacterium]